jgi:hypothetical protein
MNSKRADQVEVGDKIWHGSSVRTVVRVNRDYLQNWAFTFGPSKTDWAGWFFDAQQIPMAD